MYKFKKVVEYEGDYDEDSKYWTLIMSTTLTGQSRDGKENSYTFNVKTIDTNIDMAVSVATKASNRYFNSLGSILENGEEDVKNISSKDRST